MAVKERSPATVTLYVGYTNGLISYFPTAAEYPFGGYEPGYGEVTWVSAYEIDPFTISVADKVALLRDGVIAAIGTHAHLLATQPRYRELMSGLDEPVTGEQAAS